MGVTNHTQSTRSRSRLYPDIPRPDAPVIYSVAFSILTTWPGSICNTSSCCIDASMLSSMLASPLPPSFLDTYSLSTSSLGCNALCMVISFLVFLSICLSSSLVNLRKCPEYLTRGTAQVFISLMRFLLESFVSSSFVVFLRYSFRILSFISPCLMVSASKILRAF